MSMHIVDEDFQGYKTLCQVYTNFHNLIDYMRSPAIYKAKADGVIKDKDSAAMAIGRAFHTLVLEPDDVFEARYAVGDGPINKSTGKPYGRDSQAYAKWAAEQDKDVISCAEYDQMLEMRNSIETVMANKDVFSPYHNEYYEQTIRGAIDCINVQGRIDFFNDLCVTDIKTCDDLDDFERDARRYNYGLQMAWYAMLLYELDKVTRTSFLIAVERQQPYRAGCWQLTSSCITSGQSRLMQALKDLENSKTSGIWPTGYETLRMMDI